MAAQELPNILSPGVVDVDLVLGHPPKLRDSERNSLRLIAGSPESRGSHAASRGMADRANLVETLAIERSE
jgi:hypothetical protein